MQRVIRKGLAGADLVRRVMDVYRREGITAVLLRLIAKVWGSQFAARRYRYRQPVRSDEFPLSVIQPSFSIVVPIYNTPPEWLEAAIASVKAQWYPHWQLVLADDASTCEATKRVLTALNHPQIQVLSLSINQGISAATNAAIEVATGEFIVFMDHDDTLTVDCLYELALCIEREQADFIYSDEDKIDAKGRYCHPHFKPDWSPDTMMSLMYTGHVCCIRQSVLKKVGPLNSAYDACQDWDLVLRISEQTKRISHIPKVLYHWRMIAGSTAANFLAKPEVFTLSKKMREATLHRRSLQGTLEPLPEQGGYFRVNYALQDEPLISIIIPTRDNAAILRRCIDSIQTLSRYHHFEIVIVDNGSIKQETVAYFQALLEQTSNVRILRHDVPFNFSEVCNVGARFAKGDLLLFLNDDTEVLQEDWLERMGGYAQLSHIGAVGAKLIYPGGKRIQHVGVVNVKPGPSHAFLRQRVEQPGYVMRCCLEYNWLAVTGACLMITRSKFEALTGFSEELPIAYNDIDLCMRLHSAGFYNVVCQSVRLIHHESVSRGADYLDARKRERLKHELALLYERNPRYYQIDPFYNVNLHDSSTCFEFKAPSHTK